MASVKRYTELHCYQLSVEIRRDVLRLTRQPHVRHDFRFVSQIRDSARGGPRNIAEGYSRFNPMEIVNFLSYAKASIDETGAHMQDGLESKYFTQEETERVMTLIGRCIGAIMRWMAYLKSPAARRRYEQFRARHRYNETQPAPPATPQQHKSQFE